jgi:hypothetical protein
MEITAPPIESVELSEMPELYEAANIEVFTKPINQLPEIGPKSREGDEFWNSRKVRPEGKGPNFRHLPVLGFGIRYEGERAILSVPNTAYVNRVATEHNPGGFTFYEKEVQPEDMLLGSGTEFLSQLAAKNFSISKDRRVSIAGIYDSWVMFKSRSGVDHTFLTEMNISLYQHDMVDHVGMVAAPASEVDKIARISANILSLGHLWDWKNDRGGFIGYLDRALDMISAYATLPSNDWTEEMHDFKNFLWAGIEEAQGLANGHAMGLLLEGTDADHLRAIKANGGMRLALDRAAFDANIKRMQALPLGA